MENELLQPRDLEKFCKINKSTLNGYLKDSNAFPPARVDEDNGYRYYHRSMIHRIIVFKAMKKRPFRLRENEIKAILKKHDFEKLYELYNESATSLQKYLMDNKCL